MKSLLIVLAAASLLISASCLSTATLDLQKIEKTDFGKQIMKTIEIQMSSEGPVEDILSMLSDLDDEIIADQEAADAIHTDLAQKCEIDLEAIHRELGVALEDKQSASEELALDVPKFQQLTKDRDRLEEEIAATQNALVELENTRDKEAEEYNDRIMGIENALDAFNEARRIIQRLKDLLGDLGDETEDADNDDDNDDDGSDDGEDSEEGENDEDDVDNDDTSPSGFLQVRSKSAVSSKTESLAMGVLRDFRQHFQRVSITEKGFLSVANSMVQLAERNEFATNVCLVRKLLFLIDQVMSNLNEAAVDERHAEDARVAVYEDNFEHLHDNFETLSASLSFVKDSLSALDEKIMYAKNKLEDANRRVSEKNSQYSNKQSACDSEKQNYESQTQRNEEQREIIAEIAQILNAKLAVFKQYIRDRAAAQCNHNQLERKP
eukprot:TRINITY_DN1500_c0_g1_i4.p1 TRINITY_DN1500_c0_g1~~TRINITY_DN1500_c0_g1_i4.p1  ORF type:complete len:437 (-),score=215.12 TRINITY_DN1500_c0_g1_i4:684-1994(-)